MIKEVKSIFKKNKKQQVRNKSHRYSFIPKLDHPSYIDWTDFLKGMLRDCHNPEKRKEYHTKIKSKMDHFLDERELNFTDVITGLTYSSDILAIAGFDGEIDIFKVTEEAITRTQEISSHVKPVTAVWISKDASLVIASSLDKPLAVYQLTAAGSEVEGVEEGVDKVFKEAGELGVKRGAQLGTIRRILVKEAEKEMVVINDKFQVFAIKMDQGYGVVGDPVRVEFTVKSRIKKICLSDDFSVLAVSVYVSPVKGALEMFSYSGKMGRTTKINRVNINSKIMDMGMLGNDQVFILDNLDRVSIYKKRTAMRAKGPTFSKLEAQFQAPESAELLDPRKQAQRKGKAFLSVQGDLVVVARTNWGHIDVYKRADGMLVDAEDSSPPSYTRVNKIEAIDGIKRVILIENAKFVIGLFQDKIVKIYEAEEKEQALELEGELANPILDKIKLENKKHRGSLSLGAVSGFSAYGDEEEEEKDPEEPKRRILEAKMSEGRKMVVVSLVSEKTRPKGLALETPPPAKEEEDQKAIDGAMEVDDSKSPILVQNDNSIDKTDKNNEKTLQNNNQKAEALPIEISSPGSPNSENIDQSANKEDSIDMPPTPKLTATQSMNPSTHPNPPKTQQQAANQLKSPQPNLRRNQEKKSRFSIRPTKNKNNNFEKTDRDSKFSESSNMNTTKKNTPFYRLNFSIYDVESAEELNQEPTKEFSVNLELPLEFIGKAEAPQNGNNDLLPEGADKEEGPFNFLMKHYEIELRKGCYHVEVTKTLKEIFFASKRFVTYWTFNPKTYNYEHNKRIFDLGDKITSFRAAGKGLMFAAGLADKRIRVYRKKKRIQKPGDAPDLSQRVPEDYKLSEILLGHKGLVTGVEISRDKKILVSGAVDKRIIIWTKKINPKTEKLEFAKHQTLYDFVKAKAKTCCIRLSEESNLLIVSDGLKRSSVFVRGIEGKRKFLEVQRIHHGFQQAIFSKNRPFLLTTESEYFTEPTARIWQVYKSGITQVATFKRFKAVCATPNFSLLFSFKKNCWEPKLKVYELNTKPEIFSDFETMKKLLNVFTSQYYFIQARAMKELIRYYRHKIGDVDAPVAANLPPESPVKCKKGGNKGLFKMKDHLLTATNNSSSNILTLNAEEKEMFKHSKLNILLLAVISKNPALIRDILERDGYRPFYYSDGFDPIQCAMEINHTPSLDILADYLTKHEHYLWSFMDRQRFILAMKTSSLSLKDLMLRTLISPPKEFTFKEVKKIEQYPLDKKGYTVLKCSSFYHDDALKLAVEKKIAERLNNRHDEVKVDYLTTKISLQYNILSDLERQMLISFKTVSNDVLMGDLRYVIIHFWHKNWLKIVGFIVFEWLGMLSFILFVVYFQSNGLLAFTSIFIALLRLLFEILIAFIDFKGWLNGENMMDVYQQVTIPIICTLYLIDAEMFQRPFANTMVNITILITGFRALSGLRILDSVRFMISMITQVFVEMLGFAIILLSAIIVFAAIRLHIMTTKSIEPNFNDYLTSVNYYFNVGFAAWDSIDEMNFSELTIHYVSAIFIAVVMMNLLIGIVSMTFESFQAVKDLVDMKEMVTILVEYSNLYSYFNRYYGDKVEDEQTMICILKARPIGNSGLIQAVEEARERVFERIESSKKEVLDALAKQKDEMKRFKDEVRSLLIKKY